MKSLNEINNLVFEFVEEVINDPLVFFSEADLQSILFCKLYTKYDKKFPTSYQKGNNSKTYYTTTQIHREYGLNQIPNSRMDLVFFDRDNIKKIDSPNLTINGKYIDPIIGFELGTHKITDFMCHLVNDVNKLKVLNQGYIIYILRDETKSASNTDTGRNTKTKFEKDIEKPLSNFDFPENIIPLIFSVKIQKKEKIWGKCSFFNKEEKAFNSIGLDKIKTVLMNYYDEI